MLNLLSSSEIKDNQMRSIRIVPMMIAAVFFWGLAFPFIKIVLRDLSFINLTIMRLFLTCFFFLLLLFVVKPQGFMKMDKKDIPAIFSLGFFGVVCYHLGLNYGEQYVSPSAASLIIATAPVTTLMLSIPVLREKLTVNKTLGMFLSLLGVVIISLWGTKNAAVKIEYVKGAAGVLLAAVAASFYTILGKKMLNRYKALQLTAYAMFLGSLGLIPMVNYSLLNEVKNMSPGGWIGLFFLAIFSTVIGYFIWFAALEVKDASELSVYLYAIPVVSTVVSYFVMNQPMTFLLLVGGGFVISGLIILNSKKNLI